MTISYSPWAPPRLFMKAFAWLVANKKDNNNDMLQWRRAFSKPIDWGLAIHLEILALLEGLLLETKEANKIV